MTSFFLLDAVARFSIALILIPFIIYTYSMFYRKIQIKKNSNVNIGITEQFMYILYMIVLIFLTDDLFFKFSYLKNEFKRYIHTTPQENEQIQLIFIE